MKYLLDTQILLWAADDSKRLSAKVRKVLTDNDNELVFSAASVWEISIKNSLGRADFAIDPERFRRALIENLYLELPITGEHAAATTFLPQLHRDPFDRLLIAQAMTEGIALLTADAEVARYPGSIYKV